MQRGYLLNKSGFTLIETALVILISGMLFAAGASLYNNYQEKINMRKAATNIELTQNTLEEFFGIHGRYPCPADPTLPSNNANYGVEQCRNFNPIVNPSTLPACPGDITCVSAGARDSDSSGFNDTVMIGIVPFRTLNKMVLKNDYRAVDSIDGYGMRLSYAVSELMASSNLYSNSDPANAAYGTIDVRDEHGNSVIRPEKAAHYVVWSHGNNKRGAYSPEGVRNGDCVVLFLTGTPPTPTPAPPGGSFGAAGGSGIETDKENCDDNDAIFVKGLLSRADTDDYYDDLLYFGITEENNLWEGAPGAPNNQEWMYNTNIGYLGIGTDSPDEELHVVGDVRAQTGLISEKGFCPKGTAPVTPDGDGNVPLNCINPDKIGGAGSACPAGQAAIGIERNKVICDTILSAPITWDCSDPLQGGGPGYYLVGFNSNGTGYCELLK